MVSLRPDNSWIIISSFRSDCYQLEALQIFRIFGSISMEFLHYNAVYFSSTDPTTQSVGVPPPPPHAAQTSVTATTPPTTHPPGCRYHQGAGKPRSTPVMANPINTTWTWTLTLTHTRHPPPHALSTCQLRKAAPHPPPLNDPTSTCAPLLPPPAPTHRDPPTAWVKQRDEVNSLVSSGIN